MPSIHSARLGLQVLKDRPIAGIIELLIAHEDLRVRMILVQNAGVVLAEMDESTAVRGGCFGLVTSAVP